MRQSPDERGQTLVEFALVIPIVLLLMLGLFDLGRIVFINNTLSDGARHGARNATIDPRAVDYCTDIDTSVRTAIGGQGLSDYTVSLVTIDGDGDELDTYLVCEDGADSPNKVAMAADSQVSPGSRVTIELGADVDLALGFIAQAAGQRTFSLHAQSTMQVTFAPRDL